MLHSQARAAPSADGAAETPAAPPAIATRPGLAVPAPAAAETPAAGRAGATAPVLVAGLTVAAARRAPARPAPMAPPARPPLAPVQPPTAPPEQPPRGARPGWRASGLVRRLRLVQVVCWQVAAVAVVLAVRQPWPALVCVCAGAAVLVTLTAVRVDGRWLFELAALATGYLTHARRRDLPAEPGRTPALLDMLVPGCAVRSTETGHGTAMTVSHRGGLTVVLRPRGGDPDLAGLASAPAALLPVADGRPPAVGVQAVWHATARRDRPARLWLAVHAARDVDTPGDDELTLVLRNAVRRTRRALKRAGVPVEPLDEDAALAVIGGLAHVTAGHDEVREHWRFWCTGTVRQAAFALRGWHRLDGPRAGRLIADLFAVTAGTAVTITVGARPGRDGPRVYGVLRLAATGEAAVAAAAAAVTARAAASGVRPARLDGSHARGVAASLPIGVFLP